jgi:hypothetical protein
MNNKASDLKSVCKDEFIISKDMTKGNLKPGYSPFYNEYLIMEDGNKDKSTRILSPNYKFIETYKQEYNIIKNEFKSIKGDKIPIVLKSHLKSQ